MEFSLNPLVSIIIPVYNGSNYVREAIDSALAQTYKNIEIIVINDGSTDNTEKIVKSYGSKLRYFKKENGGVATALNLGIEKMKGEYFSWLSHDDMYYPYKIEKQINTLFTLYKKNGNNTKNIILMSNYSLINEKSKKTHVQHFEKTHLLKKNCNPFFILLNGLVGGCTLLIPKKCFDEVGLFNPKLKATQDYDLWFEMFPKYKIIFTKNLLVKTRVHSEQGTKKIKNVIKECDKLWIKMIKNISDDQKINIFGSIKEFYKEVYKTVDIAGYIGAKKYLFKFIDKSERTKKYFFNSNKEKLLLDKVFLYPIIGCFLVRVYLKIKKMFHIYE